jgi:hypothetical protein
MVFEHFVTFLLFLPKRKIISLKLIFISMFVITIILLQCGCSKKDTGVKAEMDTKTKSNIKKITFRFIDSSVPPEYHRSYTITVTQQKANIIVNSYGKIIAKKEFNIKKQQFEDILKSLDNNKIRNLNLGENHDCTGGTTEELTYFDELKEIFSGTVYHFAGIDSGNLAGDLQCCTIDIKKLIPNLDKLLK